MVLESASFSALASWHGFDAWIAKSDAGFEISFKPDRFRNVRVSVEAKRKFKVKIFQSSYLAVSLTTALSFAALATGCSKPSGG